MKRNAQKSKDGDITRLIERDIYPTGLTLAFIKKTRKRISGDYSIPKIYLFGSYAHGEAKNQSDVDIL